MFGQDDSGNDYFSHIGGAPAPGSSGPVDPSAGVPQDQPQEQPQDDTQQQPDQTSPPPSTGGSHDELLDIKQEALQSLSPLVGHLDQSPEEKFRTTMMMIQASDDQGLLREAYEAAKQIGDEKERAQALLDVVNEINYFTQQHKD